MFCDNARENRRRRATHLADDVNCVHPDIGLVVVTMVTMGVRELTFRIVLEDPPAGVDFGLQIGRGAEYETVQTQRSTGKDLSFEFSVGVATAGRRTSAPPELKGPVVQGPPSQRFICIDIGTYAGQRDTPWSRRLKVPLIGITSEMVDRATQDAPMVVETRVPGTGKDGGPNCATVKPFDGWTVRLR